MYATTRTTTTVLPEHRIEITAPTLPVGSRVEVIVVLDTDSPPLPAPEKGGILDFIDSLPPSQKTPEEWEQFERDFQAERNSWDR
jgi:hypothetical protein